MNDEVDLLNTEVINQIEKINAKVGENLFSSTVTHHNNGLDN